MLRAIFSGCLFYPLLAWTGPAHSPWAMLGAYILGALLTFGGRIHINITHTKLVIPDDSGKTPPPPSV